MDQLKSAKEIAFLMGISVRLVTNLANEWHQTAGLTGIPAMRIGGLWRFQEDKVREWLEAQYQATSARPSIKPLRVGAKREIREVKDDPEGRWADDGGNNLD